MDRVDCIVIGAGVVGLACARALALRGLEVIIVESQEGIGMETSSRHSEVIHAGIYYPAGTNKANWCVSGKTRLYDYCIQNNIPYKNIGKLIVATNNDEIKTLEEIKIKAQANGVHDLEFIATNELQNLEPNLHAVAALFSPSTGIIDSHAFMLSLLGQAEANGCMLAVNSSLASGTVTHEGTVVEVKSGNVEMELLTPVLINSAGLYASKVARSITGIDKAEIPETYYRKGNYFSYAAANIFQHLVYPVPVPGGLGIHGTLDMAGQLRFGPDVEWIEEINYDVDPSRREAFAASISRYFPAVQENLLQPGYAGIRPTLADKQGGFRDFCIQKHKPTNQKARVVGLYGMESPGMTSSLAIAEYVAELACA